MCLTNGCVVFTWCLLFCDCISVFYLTCLTRLSSCAVCPSDPVIAYSEIVCQHTRFTFLKTSKWIASFHHFVRLHVYRFYFPTGSAHPFCVLCRLYPPMWLIHHSHYVGVILAFFSYLLRGETLPGHQNSRLWSSTASTSAFSSPPSSVGK